MSRKAIRILCNILIVALVACACWGGWNIYSIYRNEARSRQIQSTTQLTEPDASASPASGNEEKSYAAQFRDAYAENSDFIGWIVFDSGLVNQPVVRTTDNDYYLNHNFAKEVSSHGTVFMDCDQAPDNGLITLYGHYVYADTSLMFSPLDQLRDQANYQANRTFSLYLQDERKEYEVAAVVVFDAGTDETYYRLDHGQITEYLDYIRNHELYTTGVELTADDSLITLQTCVRDEKTKRTLVIGRLVKTEAING